MPRSPNRLQVGQGHPRLPSPALVGQQQARPTPTGVKPSGPKGTVARQQPRQVVPVSVLNAFYQMLPSPNIQQQSLVRENVFDVQDVNAGFTIGEVTTPTNQVYVWNNIIFYGTTPGSGMTSPPYILQSYQLSGLIQFIFEVDNKTPFNLTANTVSPYRHPTRFPAPGNIAGWNAVDVDFGATRQGTGFAIYARSGQITRTRMTLVQSNRLPRFQITMLGSRMSGFVVPEGEFEQVWRKNI